ncbi:hypothetical protein CY35_10G041300 [Sphagnum magellanicum]|nr:hypothetical protein CY35_10G041300 [Sphagnum magellanicum]
MLPALIMADWRLVDEEHEDPSLYPEIFAACDLAAEEARLVKRCPSATAATEQLLLTDFAENAHPSKVYPKPLVTLPPSPQPPGAFLPTRHHHHQPAGVTRAQWRQSGSFRAGPSSSSSPSDANHQRNLKQERDKENWGHPSKRHQPCVVKSGGCERQQQVSRVPVPLQDMPEHVERVNVKNEWQENTVASVGRGKCGDGTWMADIPSAMVFKHFQDAAMQILVQGDYMMMQGKPFIKKSGWRKIAFFFNISFEIKDKNIQFDPNCNVIRAEFVVRASMQSGRFSDGWGSCDRGEKRFSKPNHDIPCTAETRAKNRACQDLLGIGEYKSGGDDTAW